MKTLKLMSLVVMTSASLLYGADNEIYVDQSGATANIDLEQLGNSNIIGGLDSVAGTLTALDLDGLNLTLDINQIGNTNKFLGDILGDNITGFFEFDGVKFAGSHHNLRTYEEILANSFVKKRMKQLRNEEHVFGS